MFNSIQHIVQKILGIEPQAWLFDSTIYCRVGGLDPDKIKQNNFAGILIQTGRGNEIASTLQDQIDVAEECKLPWAGWHIPDPRDGSMASQAQLIADQPRMQGHLLIGDLEPRENGNWSSMVSSSEGHDFLEALADVSGRSSWGYTNPNILLNIFGMPDWAYDFDWWIAQYPSFAWKRFEEFLRYYAWKYPSYFSNDTEFCKRIKTWQWTQWGDAQYYYAATTLPSGGSGIKSGDLNVAMMTKSEIQSELAVSTLPPTDQKLEDRVNVLESQMVALTYRVVENEDLIASHTAAIANVQQDLANHKHETIPDPGSDTMIVRAKKQFPLGIAVDHDGACDGEHPPGKPIIEHPPVSERIIYTEGETIKVYRRYAYSCKDDPVTPTILATGRVPYYVAVDGYTDKVSFIRADLVEVV